MPFIYCTECGYKNVFTTRKAKFCAGCGKSLIEETTGKSNPTPDRLQSTQANLQEDYPVEGIPHIEKLEYTIDLESKPPTIGDLINTSEKGSERFERKAKGGSEALSREELESESMRECASSINHSKD
jgi:hypothetical protein